MRHKTLRSTSYVTIKPFLQNIPLGFLNYLPQVIKPQNCFVDKEKSHISRDLNKNNITLISRLTK